MDDLTHYANRPLAFFGRYIRTRRLSHAAILLAVVAAVGFSVSTQYGVKHLVDTLSQEGRSGAPWPAFYLLVFFIGADNLLWRVASWIAAYTFVHVTGDLRADLFQHLTGHAPSYFAKRLPGVLTSRITATSNAVFTIQNMFVWNVLPPCLAMVGAIAYLTTVSLGMAACLAVVSGLVAATIFHVAASGKPLHHDFADKAAVVDGEMIDVVGNIALVKAFGGLAREHRRFGATVNEELKARRRSLLYLEKLRLSHALVTIVLMLGLLAWAISLWQQRSATIGDVVLVCTLGMAVLSATRDLAVALVDVTQHMARLSEALATLLSPHELRDHPQAAALIPGGARVVFENIAFRYPEGRQVFENFSLTLEAGQRVGLVGPSGGGKSTLIALLQRFYDLDAGRILIDGQDIHRTTQASLRQAISVVPQDTALFNRSLMENIRYGRPEATDEEVWEAAIAARCRPFIQHLPRGLDTIVGDRGAKLSGGQRQRVAIARAFLKNAPILLLDEATSALDSEAEEAIREALARLMQGRTVIAIAHRLSTLRNFDRIVVLQNGRMVQDGHPESLMQIDGPYRALITQEMSRLAEQAA
ncbi:putative ABC transporter ATP-binding protein [Methylocella tundrae]|uniref:Putative ABC transporter ATP-binding protein n=1 Tax=Methylocella tundrae TaxID=227605 RepID=A0A8B6M5P6_METTU|nr:ABC transporter ATP-binding protein [Methylocella tundrae]VTZ22744.1 ABC transporter [Methylocella tundrae]VTZ50155.1 putative ABC transporter ATP-binding protein [Methylocella tundrae]